VQGLVGVRGFPSSLLALVPTSLLSCDSGRFSPSILPYETPTPTQVCSSRTQPRSGVIFRASLNRFVKLPVQITRVNSTIWSSR
jgi:hypothetical protein